MNTHEVSDDLLKLPTPKIILSGKVDLDMRMHAFRSLVYLTSKGSPDVEIVIESAGGDIGYGLDIYDAIRLYKGRKTGIVISKAASMAAIILQSCDRRLCSLHANILVHNGSVSIDHDILSDDLALASFKLQKQRTVSLLHLILSVRTGKTIPEIADICKQDRWATSQEALSLGLIDEII
ncbi:MAG: ATP-dependent Clp protease proteolytic subunit [bacterium]